MQYAELGKETKQRKMPKMTSRGNIFKMININVYSPHRYKTETSFKLLHLYTFKCLEFILCKRTNAIDIQTFNMFSVNVLVN